MKIISKGIYMKAYLILFVFILLIQGCSSTSHDNKQASTSNAFSYSNKQLRTFILNGEAVTENVNFKFHPGLYSQPYSKT